MKTTALFFIFVLPLFFVSGLHGQQFVRLLPEKTLEINGYDVSYIASLKKTRKGEDYYRITVTVTNTGNDFLQLFREAQKNFDRTYYQPVAYFQFVNATGRGLSATSGKIYPRPLTISVPYACKKCPPPTDSKADKYNHYVMSYYIGLQFRRGSTLSHTYDIRVHKGEYPVVRVMVY